MSLAREHKQHALPRAPLAIVGLPAPALLGLPRRAHRAAVLDQLQMEDRLVNRVDAIVTALALRSVKLTNHPRAFLAACLVVLVWALFGPPLHYSDTWQLTINTGTTIATFLLGFLTQYALTLAGDAHRERLEDKHDALHEKVDQVHAALTRSGLATLGDAIGKHELDRQIRELGNVR